VQVATGIAAIEGSPERPGALPAQALDHGTGYLLAAAVLRALTEQSEQGHSLVLRLALARTAAWLTAGGDEQGGAAHESRGTAYNQPDAWLVETDSGIGRLRHALPPVSFVGGPVNWSRPPGRWGTDSARWA
jgi:hypothetical protein